MVKKSLFGRLTDAFKEEEDLSGDIDTRYDGCRGLELEQNPNKLTQFVKVALRSLGGLDKA